MIDWYLVSFNALWIIGLGFVTAGLSLANYHDWHGSGILLPWFGRCYCRFLGTDLMGGSCAHFRFSNMENQGNR
jgi:hypothetical protein